MLLSGLILGQCASRENDQGSTPTPGEIEGIIEFAPEEAYSARPDSSESKLRPQMRVWAGSFRQAALPIVQIFLNLESDQGFGEVDCGLIYALQSNFGSLEDPPDLALARLVAPFHGSLREPVRLCQIWDPGPLAEELLFVEQGLAVIDLNLATYYGYQALPEVNAAARGSSGHTEPLDLGNGEVRIRHIRNQ